MGSSLFSSFKLRSIEFRNRIGVSPMCQYSSEDGFASDWHFVHLGSRAQGGAGLVIMEASAVLPEGRISPEDLGIWKDAHIAPLERIVRFIHTQAARAGIQTGARGAQSQHMVRVPEQERRGACGRWGLANICPQRDSLCAGVSHACGARSVRHRRGRAGLPHRCATRPYGGFDLIELHAAHGYLLHQFLSPLSNQRTDRYGGSFENRTRLAIEVVDALRSEWPEHLPLFVRISATDWVEGGWNADESVALARLFREHGVDLVDCSSGALVPFAYIPVAPGFQVQFAERIRREAGIATAAVGLITDAAQANTIVEQSQADIVLLAREMLRDPYWPLHAAAALGERVSWPVQYLRAAPQRSPARTAVERPDKS